MKSFMRSAKIKVGIINNFINLPHVGPFILYIAILFYVLITAFFLIESRLRKFIIVAGIVGWLVVCIKIWIIQNCPQELDFLPDSATYQRHAQAFAQHWLALSLDSSAFELNGLLARSMDNWTAGENISYTLIFGSQEWLYSAFIAYWMLISTNWQLWGAYTIFMCEWSTRQRAFMVPIFFIFSAFGFSNFYRFICSRLSLINIRH